MIRKNKKAIELSINFIVIMILSISILSASFLLVNQFFGKAQKMKAAIDSDTESKIRSMLVAGERVAIPMYTQEVKYGDPATFGIGISNVLKDEGPTNTFKINVPNQCQSISDPTKVLKVAYNPEITIKKNDNNIALLAVDTKDGERLTTYKCDIYVTYNDPVTHADVDYADPVYKAYVKIK